MPRLVLTTPRAEAELEDYLAWVSKRAPLTAHKWYARLLEKVQSLEDNAEQWPLAEEADDLKLPLREVLFGKRSGVFRILFVIDGNTVNVLRICRARRRRLRRGDV